MFKPPDGFTIVQKVSWYAGLVIAAAVTVTVLALGFRLLRELWRWILGVS